MPSNKPTSIPFIPDDAPFSGEQRAWLNGFLAGIFSNAPFAGGASAPTGLPVAILYASQSGTAEGLGRKLVKELKALGHTPTLISLETYTPAALATQSYAAILASTYGEGDPPDAVKPFFEQLCAKDAPRLEGLRYSMFALGDKNYEHFAKFGVDLDTRLAELGATRLSERVESEPDTDEPSARWKTAFLTALSKTSAPEAAESLAVSAPPAAAAASAASTAVAEAALPAAVATAVAVETAPVIKYSRENPYLAPVVEKRLLTHIASSKSTIHMTFSIADSTLTYEAGDACGIIPQNDPRLVEEILHAAKLSGQERVQIPKAPETSLHEALLHQLVITKLSRKMIDKYAQAGNCTSLLEILKPEQQKQLDDYIYDRGFIDLVTEFPGVVQDAGELISLLPKLTPRLYSISSSPLAHSGEVHTTVAVVKYRTLNRDRGGVCSTQLGDRVSEGERVPMYIQPNRKFRLPVATDAPVIMIGPGTGIAPFRAFLHERRVLGAKGRNWLFFGDRSAASDFLYREELESMSKDGHLTRLDTAFSRDQEHKIYVQDRMIEQAASFWSWLEDGASVYVCGDATRMAKDVDMALHSIIEGQGKLSADGAKEYVQQMKDHHRYHRDVY